MGQVKYIFLYKLRVMRCLDQCLPLRTSEYQREVLSHFASFSAEWRAVCCIARLEETDKTIPLKVSTCQIETLLLRQF